MQHLERPSIRPVGLGPLTVACQGATRQQAGQQQRACTDWPNGDNNSGGSNGSIPGSINATTCASDAVAHLPTTVA